MKEITKGQFSIHAPVVLLVALMLLSGLACRAVTQGINVGPSFGFETVRGDGNVVTEERPVSGVRSVDLSGVGVVQITLGEHEALTIEGEANLLPYIRTEVRDGMLVIGVESGQLISPSEPLVYNLTVTGLEGLYVSGVGSITAPMLDAGSFALGVSGSGDVNLAGLTAETLNVDLSGLGDISVDGGQVGSQEVSISGSGSYAALDLQSAQAQVNISSLGTASVWVTEALDVNISGAGNVRYRGEPASIDQNISGLGELKKVE
ncbi:MAG TPA: head GIN domain-containing protein [Anaerolineales bacterium]|nr:head GIN domain-containing protein [Anaerolineales bacterium]